MLPFIQIELPLLSCTVHLLKPSRHPQCAKGRDSLPSRRCWRVRRRWGKKRGSMRPVHVHLCGRGLSSNRLLYTPRNSRRSSGSLFRPDTRRHKGLQIPASTWSCLKRWLCVEEVSHRGLSSSENTRSLLSTKCFPPITLEVFFFLKQNIVQKVWWLQIWGPICSHLVSVRLKYSEGE